MLREVTIENLAIIKKIRIPFTEGLNVITGETGAGKSIVLHALALLTGARAKKTMIRTGTAGLYVEGRFAMQDAKALHAFFEEIGIDTSDDELVLSRTVRQEGRSSTRVQGQLISAQEFGRIGQSLLDVYGQKDRVLLDQENQLDLLDTFLTEEPRKILLEYQKELQDLRAEERFVAKYGTDTAAREREADVLRYQMDEIERFGVKETDLDALYAEHKRLLHASDILSLLSEADERMSGNDLNEKGVSDGLHALWSISQKLEHIDPETRFSANLTEIIDQFAEFRSDLSRYGDSIDIDPIRLDELDRKMSEWTQIQRKYGESKEEILAFHENAVSKLKEMDTIDQRLLASKKRMKTLEQSLMKKAEVVSVYRQRIAKELCSQIEDKLHSLRMQEVVFEIRFEQTESFTDSGIDRVVFYIQTNKGLAIQPLHEIASGGEVSRVMLAIRSLFASGISSQTVVFDEIDTGVSGLAAQAMAEQIYRLSNDMQIIAVSHLPQIAAMGDAQYFISKETRDGETQSEVTLLSEEGRVEELSRLISGAGRTQSAFKQAQTLLHSAAEWKREGGQYGIS